MRRGRRRVGLEVGRSDKRLRRGHRGAHGRRRRPGRVEIGGGCRVGHGAGALENFGRGELDCLVMVVVGGVVVLVGGHGRHGHVVIHHVDVRPVGVLGVGIGICVAVAVVLHLLGLVANVAGIVAEDSIVGVGGGGGGAMNSLVQIRVLVSGAEALGQVVLVSPAVGPACGGRGFRDPVVWSTPGLHHVESSVRIEALVDVEGAETDGRQLAARAVLRNALPGCREQGQRGRVRVDAEQSTWYKYFFIFDFFFIFLPLQYLYPPVDHFVPLLGKLPEATRA